MGKRKHRVLKTAIAAVLLAAAAALIFFVFRVKTVDVYGNTQHTAEEIMEDLTSGFLSGNTLYLSWKYRKNEIPGSMPYLESLQVNMKSPSHIEAIVTERTPVACISAYGYAFFDSSGIVLGISESQPSGIPLVTGMSTEEVVLYQKVPAQSSAQLRTVLSLSQLLQEKGLSASEIRFGDDMEITVYIDRVEVRLGQDEYLEEKVANLSKILTILESQAGVLHLESFTGRNETVSFSPSDEPESEILMGGTVGNGSDENDNKDTGTGEDTSGGTAPEGGDQDGTALDGSASEDPDQNGTAPDDAAGDDGQDTSGYSTIPMVFNSSGTLVYNVHIENGAVVDEYGNEVPGCYVNEDGNVVDAYMNVLDPNTGDLVQ